MGRGRPGRAAAKTAAAALKNTPQYDVDDEPMDDAAASDGGTPLGLDAEAEAEEEEEGTPARDTPSLPSTPIPEEQPIIRKKRLGRPPKIKPADYYDGRDTPSEGGTPNKRGGGRGRGGYFRGGGRWGRRGGPSHVTQQPVDKQGNTMDVIDDEVVLPEDEEGEKKVDKFGHLQDGREYRCRTFTVLGRGERLYMLSTEPARCVGFRDSYLFFTKHKRLFKIIISEEEKRDLIDRELIPHSYKGRAIGIVTARSVFREFGAQIIVGGKRIKDDYEVAKAKADGVVEGELADPNDLIKEGEAYNKNQYVAWHGASSVYHSGAPTVPMANGKLPDGKKRRVLVNDVNWMLEHAREASQFNAKLGAARRQNLAGLYDPHTNIMQYPATMQPTHARWERVPPPTHLHEPTNGINGTKKSITTTTTTTTITADQDGDTDMTTTETQPQESSSLTTTTTPPTIFTPVPPIYSRNYLIVDTVYETPPAGITSGIPGPDSNSYDIGFNGLDGISDEIKDLLPEECRVAFEKALIGEREWKRKWGGEGRDGMRADMVIHKGFIGPP